MTPQQTSMVNGQIHVENVGGIEEVDVELAEGVTVLKGRNATNRTSLLEAIMAALGSENVSLKGDTDEGYVEFTFDGETYTRTLKRQNGTVHFSGDPYLDDPELADLFAFLLESSEVRRSVARSEDLREIIMRPIDTDKINAEIERTKSEKQRVEEKLEEIESLKQQLPDLEKERTQLRNDIDDKREQLESKEAELNAADASVEETQEEKQELEEKLEALRNSRSDLEDIRFEIDNKNESIASLKQERNELESELDELPETPAGRRAELESEIEQLRRQKEKLEGEMNELQTTIQFNEDMLNGSQNGTLETLKRQTDSSEDAITDQLVEDTIVCWTCGTETERDQVEATLDQLRTLREEKLSEVRSIEDELSDLRDEKSTLSEQQRRRETIEEKLRELDSEIETRITKIEEKKERREELTDRIETLEAEVEELEQENFSELFELHREANQLEYELGRLEGKLEEVNDEIASIEAQIEEQDELEDERDNLTDQLEELRTRIERREREAIEQFNDHMETVLEILEYDNIERIWIERLEREVREGRRKVSKSKFEMHVIRTTESGTTYEDTIDHLSESERVVTGLVFALAGFLTHEVHELTPFMLLDSLEAIDAERISNLISYFKEHVPYLVVALLPEDAEQLETDHNQISGEVLGST